MQHRACWYERLHRLLIAALALLAVANVLCAAGRIQLGEPWCLHDEISSSVGRVAELRQDLFGGDLR